MAARPPCLAVLALAALAAAPAAADILVATRTIRAQAILVPEDLAATPGEMPGTYATPEEAAGLEARVTIYAGRPIRLQDLGPPATVARNQIVVLLYRRGGLLISAEGRALERGGPGDTIRVLNSTSRTTVSGRIGADGMVQVGPAGAPNG